MHMRIDKKLSVTLSFLAVFCFLIQAVNSPVEAGQKKPAVLYKKNVTVTQDITLNFKLPNGERVQGNVKDAGGTPLMEASVVAIKKGMVMTTMTETDKNGNWELYLTRGEYELVFNPTAPDIEVQNGDYAARTRAVSKSMNITVPHTTPVNVQLDNGVFYDGKILDEEGKPAFGSGIFAYDSANEKYYGGIADLEKGTFQTNLPKGTYDLIAIRALHIPAAKFPNYGNKALGKKLIDKDTETTVNMPKLSVLQGFVKDKAGQIVYSALNFMNYQDKGKPWMRNTFALNFPQDSFPFNDTAANFSYKAALKGKYAIQIIPLHMKGLDIPYSERATILKVNKYNIQGNKKANYQLPEGNIVEGKVTDKKNQPLASAMVIFTTGKNQAKLLTDRNVILTGTITSDKGEYYCALPDGKYYVYVVPDLGEDDAMCEQSRMIRELSQDGIDGFKASYLMNRILQRIIDNLYFCQLR